MRWVTYVFDAAVIVMLALHVRSFVIRWKQHISPVLELIENEQMPAGADEEAIAKLYAGQRWPMWLFGVCVFYVSLRVAMLVGVVPWTTWLSD